MAMNRTGGFFTISILLYGMALIFAPSKNDFVRIKYHHPDLAVDLGVGLWAWPMPMDYDGDGDYDMLVSCDDKPYNGLYFFENTSGPVRLPVFEPGVRIAAGLRNVQVCYHDAKARVLIPGHEFTDLDRFVEMKVIFPQANVHENPVRANQWKWTDYENDGDLDLIVGVGDWTEYGWDNAFNSLGQWTRGPLHGYVYLIRNNGTDQRPLFAAPVKLTAVGKAIDVYGMPSPNLADFDGDGDLDLLCGEFLDKFTYFENIGTRQLPRFAKGRFLTLGGRPITMDLQMILPVALDWDRDGDVDLIVGQEDGRVAFLEHTGRIVNGMPQFETPVFFQQRADDLKFGALVTPFSVDWDGDGDEDLICGNTAGYIGFIENLDGGDPPSWAKPVYLTADGKVIRIQAGVNGSIQGPCEAKWGYTVLSVADWDGDGLLDVIVNSIWGKVVWFKNVGSKTAPKLAAAKPVQVEWQGAVPKPAWFWWTAQPHELATQWRTTPYVIDLNSDGLNDLVMLDHEGYLVFFERIRRDNAPMLLPGKRVFKIQGPSEFDSGHRAQNAVSGLLRLNNKQAGASGRRKFCLVDWDLDGRIDLLVNSMNINFLRNVSDNPGELIFEDQGALSEQVLAGHTTSPTIVDWDRNGISDLLVGAEDGCCYYLKNPHGH